MIACVVSSTFRILFTMISLANLYLVSVQFMVLF